MAAFNVLSDAFKRPHFSVCNSALDHRLEFFVSTTRPKLRSAVVQIEGMCLLLRVCPGPNIRDRRSFSESTHDFSISVVATQLIAAIKPILAFVVAALGLLFLACLG